ncbi:uncharacterized protein IUM83_09579 [Phytophthora cinnamomi]|uniref:uncharacterized protein n=1 Tax=Phytophthora cinnamomi TaxID=4785 RepID=UPI00355A30B3|nr:hypothetical protein IUM83_09579 [Phytophthora cinnamomi]
MNNLDTVVMASVESAHMFVQAEGINVHEQPIKGFYEMTIVLLASSVKGYANHNLLAKSGDTAIRDKNRATMNKLVILAVVALLQVTSTSARIEAQNFDPEDKCPTLSDNQAMDSIGATSDCLFLARGSRQVEELYEAAMVARCQESGESLATVMRPVITTIHRRLLETFCELELKTAVSEMANDKLITAINQILATMMGDLIPDIHAIMSQHLEVDLRQKDVKTRVLNYFDKFDELIEALV